MNLYVISGIVIIAYIVLNVYVTNKIKVATYLKEERRELHKKLIWIVPFLGPLIIKNFWLKREDKPLEIMTKDKRGKRSSGTNSDNWKSLTGWGG